MIHEGWDSPDLNHKLLHTFLSQKPVQCSSYRQERKQMFPEGTEAQPRAVPADQEKGDSSMNMHTHYGGY